MTLDEFQTQGSAALREIRAALPQIRAIEIVGSCFICGPEQAKDIDILFLLPGELEGPDIRSQIADLPYDWIQGYDEETYPADEFEACRKGLVNALFVQDTTVFQQWLLAARVCRHLNLTKREDRVTIHQILMDGSQNHRTLPLLEGQI